MSDNKTAPTDVSVDEFIDTVPDERRQEEARVLRELMERVTGLPATMWGPTMVGFGSLHYKYESGREGDMFAVGFSPRKAQISLYGIHYSYAGPNAALEQLGKFTTGVSCVYVKGLTDIDLTVLEKLVIDAVKNPIVGTSS